jgi:membrane fusion protein (multidrug efflux system)
VQTGEVRDGRIGIRQGLQAGQQIVTAGQNKLFRGAAVQIDAAVQL